MSEDYRMSLLQERHDDQIEDAPEVDEEDDFDYDEWYAWLARYNAWREQR